MILLGLFYCFQQLQVVGEIPISCLFECLIQWLIAWDGDGGVGILLMVFHGDIAINFLDIFGV